MNPYLSRARRLLLTAAASLLLTGCSGLESPFGPSDQSGGSSDAPTAPSSQPASTSECTLGVDCPITAVEIELLDLINAERASQEPPRPALERDLGMDRIILWHVTEMAKQKFLSHTDKQGRRSEARARAYGDDPQIRCLEIIQWWGGTPSGRVHYEGYNASPSHRAGYLEQAPYSLGPTKWAGVAAVAGTGPEGSAFEGRPGSYTGVMLCEHPVTLTSDPFETSDN